MSRLLPGDVGRRIGDVPLYAGEVVASSQNNDENRYPRYHDARPDKSVPGSKLPSIL